MMSEPIIIALIVAIPSMLASIASALISRNNSKAINEVHLSVNGRMDELLAAARAEAAHNAIMTEQARVQRMKKKS